MLVVVEQGWATPVAAPPINWLRRKKRSKELPANVRAWHVCTTAPPHSNVAFSPKPARPPSSCHVSFAGAARVAARPGWALRSYDGAGAAGSINSGSRNPGDGYRARDKTAGCTATTDEV